MSLIMLPSLFFYLFLSFKVFISNKLLSNFSFLGIKGYFTPLKLLLRLFLSFLSSQLFYSYNKENDFFHKKSYTVFNWFLRDLQKSYSNSVIKKDHKILIFLQTFFIIFLYTKRYQPDIINKRKKKFKKKSVNIKVLLKKEKQECVHQRY